MRPPLKLPMRWPPASTAVPDTCCSEIVQAVNGSTSREVVGKSEGREHRNGPSPNHLVRALEHRLRDGQSERLGRLEIDHKIEPRRLLDGKVARFRAFQDSLHVGGRAPGDDVQV